MIGQYIKNVHWCQFWNEVCMTRYEYFRACLVHVLKNCFLFLKTKKHKKLAWGRGCVFIFCVFRILKNNFFKNNKKMFHCFFTVQNINFFCMFSLLSFCVFLVVFYVSTKVSSTQLSQPHPQALSSSLNYWN